MFIKTQRKKYAAAVEKSKKHDQRSNIFIGLTFLFLLHLVLSSGDTDLVLFLELIPELAGYGGLVVFGILSWLSYNSNQAAKNEILKQEEISSKLIEFTWVECKNIKSNVKRDMVLKLKHAFDEHNKSIKNKIKTHKQDVIYKNAYFVTSSGYSSDALAKARDFKISCYVKDDKKGFKKVR